MQLGSGRAVIPFPQWVQGRAMLGDQENLTFTAQKAVDWLIILKFSAVWRIFVQIWAHELIVIRDFLVSWKIFVH